MKQWKVEPWYISGVLTGYRVRQGSGESYTIAHGFVGNIYETSSFNYAKDNAEALAGFMNCHTEEQGKTLIKLLDKSVRIMDGCLDYIPVTEYQGNTFKIKLWDKVLYPTGDIERSDRSVGIMNDYFGVNQLVTEERQFIATNEFSDEDYELLSDFVNELYHEWNNSIPRPEGW